MIPEVAAVVEAAQDLVAASKDGTFRAELADLGRAVDALNMRASRPTGAVTHEEQDRTWGEVVVQDEILSAKTKRWYEVTNSVVDEKAGTIKLNIKGSAKPIIRPVGDPVRVKRGVMGDAVDTLDLLWSGTHTLGQHRTETTGAGPMIQSQEEENENEGE